MSVLNRVEPFGWSQTMPRTLAGGAILGGGECCGSKLQSVHAGKKVEELYKTNHLALSSWQHELVPYVEEGRTNAGNLLCQCILGCFLR